jgi:hypothetical protein
MVISMTWMLSKQRNARAFGNEREQKNRHQMLVEIKEEFQLCERAKRGGSSNLARE